MVWITVTVDRAGIAAWHRAAVDHLLTPGPGDRSNETRVGTAAQCACSATTSESAAPRIASSRSAPTPCVTSGSRSRARRRDAHLLPHEHLIRRRRLRRSPSADLTIALDECWSPRRARAVETPVSPVLPGPSSSCRRCLRTLRAGRRASRLECATPITPKCGAQVRTGRLRFRARDRSVSRPGRRRSGRSTKSNPRNGLAACRNPRSIPPRALVGALFPNSSTGGPVAARSTPYGGRRLSEVRQAACRRRSAAPWIGPVMMCTPARGVLSDGRPIARSRRPSTGRARRRRVA